MFSIIFQYATQLHRTRTTSPNTTANKGGRNRQGCSIKYGMTNRTFILLWHVMFFSSIGIGICNVLTYDCLLLCMCKCTYKVCLFGVTLLNETHNKVVNDKEKIVTTTPKKCTIHSHSCRLSLPFHSTPACLYRNYLPFHIYKHHHQVYVVTRNVENESKDLYTFTLLSWRFPLPVKPTFV